MVEVADWTISGWSAVAKFVSCGVVEMKGLWDGYARLWIVDRHTQKSGLGQMGYRMNVCVWERCMSW